MTPARSGGPAGGSHLAGLDGIRAVAALSVLAAHAGAHLALGAVPPHLRAVLDWGNQGLTVFFVLSGFLLFRPFARALLRGLPLPAIGRYLLARVLRIYPAYVVVLVMAALVLGVGYRYGIVELHPLDNVARIVDPAVVVANLLLVQTLVPGMIGTGIQPAWSLTAELTFYALLPALAVAAVLLVRRGVARAMATLLPALLLLLVGAVTCVVVGVASLSLSPTARAEFAWGATWTAVVERSLLTQGPLFGLGMLAAWVVEGRRASLAVPMLQATRHRLYAWSAVGLAFGTLAAGPAAVLLGTGSADLVLHASTALLGAAMAAVLVLLVSERPDGTSSRLALALEWQPVRGVGVVSYSVYLWHQPVINWLLLHRLVAGGGAGLVANVGVVAAATLALAVPTYWLVERPAMRLRRGPLHPTDLTREPLMLTR